MIADSSSVSAESALNVAYFPASSLGAAIAVSAPEYKVGDTVVLAGLLFDGTNPVAGATMAATLATRLKLGSQTTIGSYSLVSQQQVSSTDSQYTYSAVITNNGPAQLGVTSNVTSSSSSVSVVEGTLVFGSVDANGTRASANTFTIQQSSQATFDPSVLTWNSGAVGTPVPISLLDSGQYDAATGDGIYTGSFVPPTSGEYTASLAASGTSGGAAFSRTATSKFQANDPNASLGAFSDAPVDTNGNGLTDIVNVTAAVTVQSAGSYRFTMNLRASNGMTMAASGTAALAAGPQQVTVGFAASGLIGLGVDGPYERVSALLLQEVGTSEAVAGYSADAGATQAYPLSSFDRGPMYFDGQNSATGIVTGQGSTFDILRVQLGVTFAPPPPGTSQWDCSWEGTLSDSNGA